MSWPELEMVAPMVSGQAFEQRPLGLGMSARLPSGWKVPSQGSEVLASAGAEPPLALVTSLAELEALAAQHVVEGADEAGEDHDDDAPEPAEAASFDRPAIASDGRRAPVLSQSEALERVAHDCADRLAALGEHRTRWPMGNKADTERRALAQVDALVCVGGAGFAALDGWWQGMPTAWATWAYVFALACIEGREAVEAVADHVAQLGPAQRTHRRLAAEAFAASENKNGAALARACMRRPGCEPFAIELLSLQQTISGPDLRAWLARPEPEIRATAMRALCRLDETPSDVPALEVLLDTTDVDQAWETARALTLWGSGAPLTALRMGGALSSVLGERATEIFVWSGYPDDVELLQRMVRRLAMTPALLDAIARFGHPGTWAFLSHYLGDSTLDAAAADALRTLFGDVVDVDAARDPFAWKDAISGLRLEPSERYRRGAVWSPAVVAAECGDAELSRHDVELRMDELRARARIRVHVPLWAHSLRHPTFATELQTAATTRGSYR